MGHTAVSATVVLVHVFTCTSISCVSATSNYMSNTLQESPMRIVSQDDCRRSYSDLMETQICVESATSSACTVSCVSQFMVTLMRRDSNS